LTFTIGSAELRDMREPIKDCVAMRRTAQLLFLASALLLAVPGVAGGPSELNELRKTGEILPFEPIRNQVIATTAGDYVGAEFDATTRRYRFRFLVEGTVINVDVDARTGKRLNARQSY
jgi:hypothetical protein